jgi:DNA repair photolyase
MEFEKELAVANLDSVERRLKRIFNDKKVKEDNFLDMLISKDYTWHMGGMSDPFQPIEEKLHITKQLIDITNKYGIHILTSTKADTVYDANIRPDLHTFQLSVTNTSNRKDLEPNVPDIDSRYKFYRSLKNDGFKVGIRIQPFIPAISNMDIIEMFYDADQITIEGIKLVPQNKEHKEEVLKLCNLDANNFTQMGLLNLKPEIRFEMYKPFIARMKELNIPYSIADNDLHYLGNNRCCCGDRLVHKSTSFNTTAMCHVYGIDYSYDDLINELNLAGIGDCKSCQLFTSNRTEGCKTVSEFYEKRFNRQSSPFSPKFMYKSNNE